MWMRFFLFDIGWHLISGFLYSLFSDGKSNWIFLVPVFKIRHTYNELVFNEGISYNYHNKTHLRHVRVMPFTYFLSVTGILYTYDISRDHAMNCSFLYFHCSIKYYPPPQPPFSQLFPPSGPRSWIISHLILPFSHNEWGEGTYREHSSREGETETLQTV